DGAPQKAKDAGLTAGRARREVLRGSPDDLARQFATKLRGLTQNEALVMAPPPAERDEWPVVLRDHVGDRTDVIARTKDYFRAPPGPAVLMLDFDSKNYPAAILEKVKAHPDKLTGVLASVFSALGSAASVVRPSVSVGIKNKHTGKKTSSLSGQHRYYFAA